ncbi:MAG: (5-formylfuran-3-yl)methyl phosphate synthase [Gemmatimonadales bacterium]
MRLLVSVRSAAEVGAALAGGADIIDAKEPSRGGLGSVDPEMLRAIAERVSAGVPLSVALGDLTEAAEVEAKVRLLSVTRTGGKLFLKLGFAGLADESGVEDLIAAAVGAAARMEVAPAVVAVAYADWRRARSPSPGAVMSAAGRSGAAGVLLDTSVKDGHGLFDWISEPALGSWIRDAQGTGVMAAVAGSLTAGALPLLCRLHPDVIGVRGAACEGGRLGRVSAPLVRALRNALDSLTAPSTAGEAPARREAGARYRDHGDGARAGASGRC